MFCCMKSKPEVEDDPDDGIVWKPASKTTEEDNSDDIVPTDEANGNVIRETGETESESESESEPEVSRQPTQEEIIREPTLEETVGLKDGEEDGEEEEEQNGNDEDDPPPDEPTDPLPQSDDPEPDPVEDDNSNVEQDEPTETVEEDEEVPTPTPEPAKHAGKQHKQRPPKSPEKKRPETPKTPPRKLPRYKEFLKRRKLQRQRAKEAREKKKRRAKKSEDTTPSDALSPRLQTSNRVSPDNKPDEDSRPPWSQDYRIRTAVGSPPPTTISSSNSRGHVVHVRKHRKGANVAQSWDEKRSRELGTEGDSPAAINSSSMVNLRKEAEPRTSGGDGSSSDPGAVLRRSASETLLADSDRPVAVRKSGHRRRGRNSPAPRHAWDANNQDARRTKPVQPSKSRAPSSLSAASQASQGRRQQKQFFKAELDRLRTSLKAESEKIQEPPLQEHVPYTFNTLEPYYNCETARFLIEQPETGHHAFASRETSLGLCDPWVDHTMDITLAEKTELRTPRVDDDDDAPKTSRTPRKQDKTKRPPKEGSTRLPKFPAVALSIEDVSKDLVYSDVPRLREVLKKKYSSDAESKRAEEYERTKQDFFRMELDKMANLPPSTQQNMRATYFAYLQNNPGSKKAIYECVKNLNAEKTT